MEKSRKVENTLVDLLVDIIVLLVCGGIFSYKIINGYDTESVWEFLMACFAFIILFALLSITYRIIVLIILLLTKLILKN